MWLPPKMVQSALRKPSLWKSILILSSPVSKQLSMDWKIAGESQTKQKKSSSSPSLGWFQCPHSFPSKGNRGIRQRVKRPKREGNHSQPRGAEANTCSFTYTPLIIYIARYLYIVTSTVLSSHLHFRFSSNYFQDISLYHLHIYGLFLSDCFISTAVLMFRLSVFYSLPLAPLRQRLF